MPHVEAILFLRTFALYSRNKWVGILLVLVGTGTVVLDFVGAFRSVWAIKFILILKDPSLPCVAMSYWSSIEVAILLFPLLRESSILHDASL